MSKAWVVVLLLAGFLFYIVTGGVEPGSIPETSLAVMPILGFLLTGLIVGAVFVFIKPQIEQAVLGVVPQLASNRFVNLVMVGVLVLVSLSIAGFALKIVGVRGSR